MLAAECDNLLLLLNGEPNNQTDLFLSPGVKRKIRCGCSDETQRVKWFFNNGTEVPPRADKSQVYSKVRTKETEGSNLFILREAPPLEYVGGYRCESDSSSASINIVIKGILQYNVMHNWSYVCKSCSYKYCNSPCLEA